LPDAVSFMMPRYLLVRAASYYLLIDATLIDGIKDLTEIDETTVDLSRALGGETASLAIACTDGARVRHLGVDEAQGLVDLADEDLVPLPEMISAAAGEDLDRVTARPLYGAHAFRLRLVHSNVPIAELDRRRSPPNR
jgi:hypothetical protein